MSCVKASLIGLCDILVWHLIKIFIFSSCAKMNFFQACEFFLKLSQKTILCQQKFISPVLLLRVLWSCFKARFSIRIMIPTYYTQHVNSEQHLKIAYIYDNCSASDYNQKYMEALAMVAHDGTVFWPPIVKFRSTCLMDVTYFPFDDQVCKMKTGSWAYDGYQVDIKILNRSNSIDLSRFVENGEWELVSATAVRNVVYYPCCLEPFPDVTFNLHIRRRTTYYMYNVIIPSVMLSSLALLGFWMHPDSGEKVTLGLTVLLALSVFMLLIAENTPATSFYVPLLGKSLWLFRFIQTAILYMYLRHGG